MTGHLRSALWRSVGWVLNAAPCVMLLAVAFTCALPAQVVTATVGDRKAAVMVRVWGLADLAEPRATSPHFDHIRRTFTDFCYCWDGAKGQAARAWAASRYDLVMSGSAPAWVAGNATITHLRYVLALTTLDEANTDGNSLTGKYQADARAWFAAHPEYDYESMWLHDTTAGTPADSAHRLNPHIWSTNRYAINPLDPGARAYTIDRLRRALAESPDSRGLFIDEADGGNVSWIAKAREGAGLPASVWQDSIVSLVAQIRQAISPAVVQTNAAGYSKKPFEMRIGEAAGNMHLELMNLATQEQPSVWAFIDTLLAHGTDVDFIGAETWTDMLNPKWITAYSGGNYAAPVYRAKVAQLASYYMVVPRDAQRVGLQIDNVRAPLTPDSADLAIYYYNVGHPKAPRSVWLSTRDPVNQSARVYRRDFDNAVVLYRPVVYWADTKMGDSTATAVPLPEGGPWSYVRARGALVPLDSLALRNSEAVILVRRQ